MQWSRKRCVQIVGMAAVVSQSNWTTVASQAPATQQVAPWILLALDSPSRLDTVEKRARALREIERSETLRENDQVRMALIGALGRANDQYQASSSADGSNPAISGHRKPGHFRRPETGVEFYFTASCVRKSVWTLVRQLRGPHFSTCA